MKKKTAKPAKPKIGRPPVGPMMSFRTSEAEKAAWEKAAAKAGVTLSSWLRDVANQAAGIPEKQR